MNCIFCRIISGEIPAYKIYEDEITVVIMDINPHTNGHLLVIPKKEYKDLIDVPNEVLIHINEVSKKMYYLLKNKLLIEGINISNNMGSLQDIKHFHMHLIPNKNNESITSVEEIYKILKNE